MHARRVVGAAVLLAALAVTAQPANAAAPGWSTPHTVTPYRYGTYAVAPGPKGVQIFGNGAVQTMIPQLRAIKTDATEGTAVSANPGAPGFADQQLSVNDDGRFVAAWMLDMAEAGRGGAYNAIAPPGSATWGELLATAREVAGGGARLRWTDPAVIEARVEEPWEALPLWPIPSLPGLYGMAGAKAAAAGLAPRPLQATIGDTWAWLAAGGDLDDWRRELRVTGLSPEVERALLRAS